jgi:hypothetical protein
MEKHWKAGDPVTYTGVVKDVVEGSIFVVFDQHDKGRWMTPPPDTPAPATWDEGKVRDILWDFAKDLEDQQAYGNRLRLCRETLTRLRSLAVPQRPSREEAIAESMELIRDADHMNDAEIKHRVAAHVRLLGWDDPTPSPEEQEWHKPCPYASCGSTFIDIIQNPDGTHSARCRDCGATGPKGDDAESAWAVWDTRLDPQPGNGGRG